MGYWLQFDKVSVFSVAGTSSKHKHLVGLNFNSLRHGRIASEEYRISNVKDGINDHFDWESRHREALQ